MPAPRHSPQFRFVGAPDCMNALESCQALQYVNLCHERVDIRDTTIARSSRGTLSTLQGIAQFLASRRVRRVSRPDHRGRFAGNYPDIHIMLHLLRNGGKPARVRAAGAVPWRLAVRIRSVDREIAHPHITVRGSSAPSPGALCWTPKRQCYPDSSAEKGSSMGPATKEHEYNVINRTFSGCLGA